MWTNPYISKQLLDIHLNINIDLASRKYESIKKTADWILTQTNGDKLNILDLGCGPGLYSEIFAKKGYNVTGIDLSKNSIDYAQQEAKSKSLDIKYINQNYLELNLDENSFDLVILIFTDFGVLLPNEREILLNNIKKVLKPNGTFIFDVLNDKDITQKTSPKNWELTKKGFWKDQKK